MKGKKPVKSSEPTIRRKKRRKRRKSNKWGAPMGATSNRGTPYTYPTGNSEYRDMDRWERGSCV